MRIIAVLLPLIMAAGCSPKSPDITDTGFADTPVAEDLRFDAEEMVEALIVNRGRTAGSDVPAMSDSAGVRRTAMPFAADSAVYFYFTPLACWECIREVCAVVGENENAGRVIYLIPERLRHASGRISAEAGIPAGRTFYLEGELGLPLEAENRIFLFTLGSPDADGRMSVDNILAPPRSLANVAGAYLDALFE